MTLMQLQHFIYTATYLNLTRAAKKLYVSHSTLSRSISALESELGVTLLVRTSHSIELTDAGKILYERGTKILNDVEDTKMAVAGTKNTYVRELHIGCALINYPEFFEAYHAFDNSHDKIKVNLHSLFPEDIYDNILDGGLDVGLTFSYAYTPSNRVSFEPFAKGSFYAYVAPKHPLAQASYVNYEDLLPYKVYISPNANRTLFKNTDFSGNVRTLAPINEITLLTKNGAAVALLPEHTADDILPDCKKIPIIAKKNTYQIGILYANSNTNVALSRFLTHIRSAI